MTDQFTKEDVMGVPWENCGGWVQGSPELFDGSVVIVGVYLGVSLIIQF